MITVCQVLGASATGRCLPFIGNNQGSVAVLGRQTGCAAVFTVVIRLHLCCIELGVDLEVEWRLRVSQSA